MNVLGPAAAAVAEVLTVGNQALVQVAGEQRDAVGAGVVAEAVAGHADLAAAGGAEHVLIKPEPVLDLLVAGGLQTGEGNRHHGDSCGRTPVLAGGRGSMRRSAIPFIRLGFFLIALKQGPQGEQLQVPLLHQLQPGGFLPVTGPWHGGRKICLQTA